MIARKGTFGKMLALAVVLILAVTGCASGGGSGGGANTYEGMSPEGQFVSAAVYGDLDTIKTLLAQGVDVDTLGSIRRPALTLAAYNGHQDIVEYLLDNGADINLTSGSGEETALIMAVKTKEADIAKYLVGKGADVNIQDANGYTALYYANESGQTDLASFLVSNGATE